MLCFPAAPAARRERVERVTRADSPRRRAPPQSPTETGGALHARGLVRQGAATARVVVRLRNSGTEAYRTEDFGATIVVERSLSAVRAARSRPFCKWALGLSDARRR